MATTAEVRFCTDASPDRRPLAALIRLVAAFGVLEDGDLRFRGFRVFTQDRLRPAAQLRDHLSPDDLLTALEPWDSPANSLSTRTSIVRYESGPDPGALRKTRIPASIGSSGGQHPGRTGDWWIDGDAHIFLDPVTAYLFPSTPDALAERADVTANVDLLVALLSAAAGSLKPLGYKVHTDSGEPFPFNAHLAYFAQPEEALRDVRLIVDLFRAGQPALQLPPLGLVDGDLADLVFHLWRARDEQRRLRRAFDEAAHDARLRPEDEVPAMITSAATPLGTAGPGLAVFDRHAPFNAFLDRFYLRLLGGNGRATDAVDRPL